MIAKKKPEKKQNISVYKKDIPAFRKFMVELGIVEYKDADADLFRKLLKKAKEAKSE